MDILLIFHFLFVFINIIGIATCYKTNENGDNDNFIERFICLAFPISNQATILIWLPFSLLGLVTRDSFYTGQIGDFLKKYIEINPISAGIINTYIEFFYIVLSYTYIYIKLNMSMKLASSKSVSVF